MKYACPVCGFDQMPFPPSDNNICSCCGTEFGYHDQKHSHAELRKAWIFKGCPWFSSGLRPEADWNPYVQMLNARLVDITIGGSEEVTLAVNVGKSGKAPTTASTDVGTIAA